MVSLPVFCLLPRFPRAELDHGSDSLTDRCSQLSGAGGHEKSPGLGGGQDSSHPTFTF